MNKIIGIFNWIKEIIFYPLTFAEHLKLLKAVNEKLNAPAYYNQDLQFAKEIFTLKIQQLKEEKEKLETSDTQQKAVIEDLINRWDLAEKEIMKLIKKNEELIEQREVFRKGFNATNDEVKRLYQEVERLKFPSNSAIEKAIYEQYSRQLDVKSTWFDGLLEALRKNGK